MAEGTETFLALRTVDNFHHHTLNIKSVVNCVQRELLIAKMTTLLLTEF